MPRQAHGCGTVPSLAFNTGLQRLVDTAICNLQDASLQASEYSTALVAVVQHTPASIGARLRSWLEDSVCKEFHWAGPGISRSNLEQDVCLHLSPAFQAATQAWNNAKVMDSADVPDRARRFDSMTWVFMSTLGSGDTLVRLMWLKVRRVDPIHSVAEQRVPILSPGDEGLYIVLGVDSSFGRRVLQHVRQAHHVGGLVHACSHFVPVANLDDATPLRCGAGFDHEECLAILDLKVP